MEDKTLKLGVAVVLLVVALLFGRIILYNVGDGERQGVVVYTRKASFPVKHTLVWIRFYYTDGIMNEDAFVKGFYGWHDFELGQLYRISYHRDWNQIYKRITELEIIAVR